jgi:hypothetical protein
LLRIDDVLADTVPDHRPNEPIQQAEDFYCKKPMIPITLV